MPPASFFLSFIGAVILGAIILIAAFLTVVLLSPMILPLIVLIFPYLAGTLLFIVAVIVVWMIIMACAYVGLGAVYFISRPANVNENSKGYGISKVKEAGRRQKKDEEE